MAREVDEGRKRRRAHARRRWRSAGDRGARAGNGPADEVRLRAELAPLDAAAQAAEAALQEAHKAAQALRAAARRAPQGARRGLRRRRRRPPRRGARQRARRLLEGAPRGLYETGGLQWASRCSRRSATSTCARRRSGWRRCRAGCAASSASSRGRRVRAQRVGGPRRLRPRHRDGECGDQAAQGRGGGGGRSGEAVGGAEVGAHREGRRVGPVPAVEADAPRRRGDAPRGRRPRPRCGAHPPVERARRARRAASRGARSR